jgi:hypothetical protein
MSGSSLTVHWLESCRTLDALDATVARLKTVRVGFPNARICVLNRQVQATAASEIAQVAGTLDCDVTRFTLSAKPYSQLGEILMDPGNQGTHVIVDSSVAFWSTCEGWEFEALIAGRLVPSFLDERRGCISMARLHPSLWWIPDAAALRARIARDYRASELGYLDAVAPYLCRDLASGAWYRFATGANLYAALKDSVHTFVPEELDCFDRIPSGGGIEAVPSGLKGLWRDQDDYYRSRAVPSVAELVFAR